MTPDIVLCSPHSYTCALYTCEYIYNTYALNYFIKLYACLINMAQCPAFSNRVLILAGVLLATFPYHPDAEPNRALFTCNLMCCGVEADIQMKVDVFFFLFDCGSPLRSVEEWFGWLFQYPTSFQSHEVGTSCMTLAPVFLVHRHLILTLRTAESVLSLYTWSAASISPEVSFNILDMDAYSSTLVFMVFWDTLHVA